MQVPKENEIVALEELTSVGEPTGIEADNEPDTPYHPFPPSSIDITTSSKTVDLLLSRLKENELRLSVHFQRRANLWTEEAKSALIESMLLGVPIPSLYVSEDENGVYDVVDGVQRLCAIAHFADVSSLNSTLSKSPIPYPPLKPLKLQKMRSLVGLESVTYDDLPRSYQRRLKEFELILHVIRTRTPQQVKFEIFRRLNRGGLPLNPQEIRNAVYIGGHWRDQVTLMANSQSFLSATSRKIKTERMQDNELVLRFVAHFALFSKGQSRNDDMSLDVFLNTFLENEAIHYQVGDWDKLRLTFDRTMIYSEKILEKFAFRRFSKDGSLRAINRGLFETQSTCLALRSGDELDLLTERRHRVIELLGNALENNYQFRAALSSGTGKANSTNARFMVFTSILEEVLNAHGD